LVCVLYIYIYIYIVANGASYEVILVKLLLNNKQKIIFYLYFEIFANIYLLGPTFLVMMKWWKKIVDIVKIKFHLNENIKWNCIQFE
jgi:hypothetical protein